MGLPDMRDLLTSFNPSLDYFAVTTGDGRIKIWDALKGQLQTEFSDIISVNEIGHHSRVEKGHLSVDYTCLKWMPFERKRKRKSTQSLLLSGTGGGDILAWDTSSGQLKWRNTDCHPGGVNAIGFSIEESLIYTAGNDGMVSQIDSLSGTVLGKFRVLTKPISSLLISPDGTLLAIASTELKIFDRPSMKKIHKFSGHPGAVRCLAFTEDGKHIISSAANERYVALWTIGGRHRSSTCVLAMDHPAVFLATSSSPQSLRVLAISEKGECYVWRSRTPADLRDSRPARITPVLSAALEPPAAVFLAYGSTARPQFRRLTLTPGADIRLDASSSAGFLVPVHPAKPAPSSAPPTVSSADALFPVPKVRAPSGPLPVFPAPSPSEAGKIAASVEERLTALGVLAPAASVVGIDLYTDRIPDKKMRAVLAPMTAADSFALLVSLLHVWHSRSVNGDRMLRWIYNVLVVHSHRFGSLDDARPILDRLNDCARSRKAALEQLRCLAGRLQLLMMKVDDSLRGDARNVAAFGSESDDESDGEVRVPDTFYGVDDDTSENDSSDTDRSNSLGQLCSS